MVNILKTRKNKGEVSLQVAAVAVLIFILITILATKIVQTMDTTFKDPPQTTTVQYTATQEYFSRVQSGATYNFTNTPVVGINRINTTNGTTAYNLTTLNYTTVSTTGFTVGNASFNNWNLTVDYNYTVTTQANTVNTWASNITGQGLSAFNTFSQWFSTIVIVIVAVVVVGLIYLVQKGGGGISI